MSTVSETQLEHLFERARSNHFNEAEFYSGLLNAMLYVHAPVSDDSKNVRLIQFRLPGGFDAIPIFTSARRCARASSKAVRALRLPCIDLLKGTKGATLMINPNDGGPVLYPEEVTALLKNGTLGTFEKIEQAGGSWDVRLAEKPSRTIVDAVCTGAASVSFIKHVYLLEKLAPNSACDEATLLIYLAVESTHLERAARHMVQVLQSLNPRPDTIIDIAVYDIAQARPEFLDRMGAVPVFGQSG
ncbi:SseB family protein [Xanthomonas euvesicatoria pv. physalidis]|uniref:SseB family protein n=1 Tax=Xanthomonas euvesicatoria TaxID=456327 RepID=UPI001C47C42D|nr:SseB family protein [Xanthomonas euvesicatoria]MBV6689830.1 SseB family protein [Xanthomonas euvesicatoria pv. physalidis]